MCLLFLVFVCIFYPGSILGFVCIALYCTYVDVHSKLELGGVQTKINFKEITRRSMCLAIYINLQAQIISESCKGQLDSLEPSLETPQLITQVNIFQFSKITLPK